ncbi:MAG TPA: IPT/TIG domain-containing protein [Ohtaekwangia sp.]|uniref:IPT/TIG domain-containing protein n=1 Tax=Ohtaekwangia sp. TaxID=2066019 RepID=UPI002F93A9C2
MERKQFLKSLGMSGLMVPLIVSCSKDDESVLTPTITSFTPTSGATGSTVTITGTNFSTVTTNNTVTFNGTAATVTAATVTQLTVTVPAGATTGKITVTVNGLSATSTSDFTVTSTSTSTGSPTITSFTASGAVGSSIVITGTNFSTAVSDNTVTINGITATVTSATTTQLVVTVPSGATSGTISVTVNGVTVTSTSSFTVTTASASCTSTDSETAGPFPTKSPSDLVKSDIRSDRTGVAFSIVITIENKNNSCSPLEGALVDIWHCDKDGYYSEYGGTSMQTVDYTSVHFLRGRQTTDSDGKVAFTSIFPGWYQSRATHVHVHVYNAAGTSLLVTQIAFPEGSNSAVALVNASTANGYTKGMSGYTYNASDTVFTDSLDTELATVTGSVADGYVLTHTIVVSA